MSLTYKGYSIDQVGLETILVPDGQGYNRPTRRMAYRVICPDGSGLGKAWGMAEARSIINEDIAGRL